MKYCREKTSAAAVHNDKPSLSSASLDALVAMVEKEPIKDETDDEGAASKKQSIEQEKSQFFLQVGLGLSSSSANNSDESNNKSQPAATVPTDRSNSNAAPSVAPVNPYQAQMQRMQSRKAEEAKNNAAVEVKKDDDEEDLGITIIFEDEEPSTSTSTTSSDITTTEDATDTTNNSSEQLQQSQQPQKEEIKRPLVHHSLYKPPPYRPRPDPRVHELTGRTRPPQTRQMLPVDQVFRPPISNLWRSKFHSFNNLQSEVAQVLVNSDDNIVVSAPTGAGKTAVFEMAMGRLFASDLRGRPAGHGISKSRKVVYISPSKALCEERYDDWAKRLADVDPSLECACVTGDASQDSYRDIASAHVIITTPEKWDGITRRWTDHVFLIGSVKLLLIDEVHLLGDDTRGCTLEAVICRMKTVQRATKAKANLSSSDMQRATYANTTEEALKTDMRIVTVSATLPNVSDIAAFVEANEAYAFDSSYRPVPLKIQVIGQGYVGKNQYLFNQGLNKRVPDILSEYSDGRPAIVFCHTKKDTEKLAIDLSQCYGSSPQANPQVVCEGGEHRITCPDRFGRIYIRLVANLVEWD